MKKLIATLLAIVMLAALSVCAFAANNFTQSPTKPSAPTVEIDGNSIEYTQQATTEQIAEIEQLINKINSNAVVLKATAYSDKDQQLNDDALDGGEDAKNILEAAVQSIKTASSVQSLVPALPAGSMVNEVFDISLIENNNEIIDLPQGAKIKIEITLAHPIPNFMYLLHYKYNTTTPANSTWENVDYNKLTANTISFTVDSLSPFAIVVKDTSSGPSSPATGASAPIACAVGAVVFGVAGAALLKKGKEN